MNATPSAPNEARSWRTRLSEFAAIDARSLAAFRIAFGLILAWDLAIRWPQIDDYYSNVGWLTNHFALFSQPGDAQFSLLFGLSDPTHVRVFFLLTAFLIAAFIAGYRQRFLQPLTLLAVLSIHARNHLVVYGFDTVTHVWLVWTLFLPLEARWSVDAATGRARTSRARPAVAELGVLIQFTIIYVSNGLNKDGPTWMNGDAVHYLLWQDSIARAPALWLRAHAPLFALKAASHATLVIEILAPLLLWSPWRRGWCRGLAVVSLAGLHIGIWLTVNVALFTPMMLVSYFLLAGPGFWEAVSAGLRRRGWAPRLAAQLAAVEPQLRAPEHRSERVHLRVREVFAAAWLGIVLLGAASGSRHLPETLRPAHPAWLAELESSLVVSQNWGLFAPEAPTEEGFFVIVGHTADGRELDPFRGGPPMRSIEAGWGARTPQEDVAYSIRLRKGWWGPQLSELERRIWSHHERTGNPADAIVAYEMYNLSRPSPAPGEREAQPAQMHLLHAAQRPAPPG